jgi:hypothetical protein
MNVIAQKWDKTIGYSYRDEWPNDVIEYYDHGYLLVGGYMVNQSVTPWEIKTDINGNILWDKNLINLPHLGVFAATSDDEGNTYVCGRTTINGYYCPLLVKFNPCGQTEWCKMYYNNYFTIDGTALDLIINSNNEIILLVYVQNEDQIDQIFLFGYNTDGNYLWKQSYASQNNYPLIGGAVAYKIIPNNNEYILSGFCYWPFPDDPNHVYLRPFFIGVDSLFNEKWIMPFAVMDSIIGQAISAIPLNDSVMMGIGRRFIGNITNSLLMFFNMEGDELGYKQISNEQIGPDIVGNFLYDIEKLENELFLVGSNFGQNFNGNPYGEFVIDTAGNVYKSQSRLGTDVEAHLTKTSDNNYVIASIFNQNSDWDIYLYKINENLEMVPLDTNQHTYDSLCPEPVTTGTINLGACDLITDVGEIPKPQEYYAKLKTIPVTAYPNPAETEITLAFQNTEHHNNMLLECYNIYGQKVHSEKIWKGQQQTKLDLNGWGKGLYFAVVKSNGKVAGTVRFVRR